MIAKDQANRALVPTVVQAIRAQAPIMQEVFVASAGPAFSGTLQFLAHNEGVSAQFTDGWAHARWENLVAAAEGSDFVIASETGALGQENGFAFPSIAFQDRLIALLNANPFFRVIATYKDNIGKQTFVFSRNYAATGSVSVSTGFRAMEGPYPQWDMPTVQWMTADRATLRVSADKSDEVILELRCRGAVPLEMVVRSMGIERRAQLGDGDFTALQIPLTLAKGNDTTVEIEAQSLATQVPSWAPGPILCNAPFRLAEKK